MLAYFSGEKRGCYWMLAIGILACAVSSTVLMRIQDPFMIGLAIPLFVVGVIEMVVGTIVLRRTDEQMDDLEKLLATNPAQFIAAETPRMEQAMRSFARYRWVEIAALLAGITLAILNADPNFWKGLGIGLFTQGAITGMVDYFATKRGRIYQTFIKGVVK